MRYFALLGLIALAALVAIGQEFYPYPQPKPTSGTTPNTISRTPVAVGPSAYNNNSPVVWDTDIGGGLQSRTNEADRLATRWMRLGAIVLDQTDRTYYAVDVLPGTETLSPWRPLFTMDGGEDVSIYSQDGDISGPREVRLGLNNLTFSGGNLNFTPNVLYAHPAAQTEFFSPYFTIAALTEFRLRLPNNTAAEDGWILTLRDKVSGRAEWGPPPTGGDPGEPGEDTSIYKGSGTMTGIREVNQNNYSLTFNGNHTTGGDIFFKNMGVVDTKAANITSHAASTTVSGQDYLGIKTPNVNHSLATPGQFLQLYDNFNGLVEYVDLPPSVYQNIYNYSGTLTGNRSLTGGNFDLVFTGLDDYSVFAQQALIWGYQELKLVTPRIAGGTDYPPVGSYLKLVDALTGRSEWDAFPADKSIYTHSDTLTADRIVTGGGKDLHFTGMDVWDASAVTLDLVASTRLGLRTPEIASASDGHVLTLLDKTSGKVDFRYAPNIYNKSDTLISDRIVNGGGYDLTFNNLDVGSFQALTTEIKGLSQVQIKTPLWTSNPAALANGQLLTLMDKTSGRVEFQSPPTPPVDTSIFTHDGTTTGNRAVILKTGTTLGFYGQIPATGVFSIYDVASFQVYAGGMNFYTPNDLIIGGGKLKVGANGGGAGSLNRVLQVIDDATAEVGFRPPQNLYNNNGTIAADRIVTGGNHALHFNGLSQLTLDSKSALYVKAPAVHNLTAANNQVLTLLNATTGEADWRTVAGPTPTKTIYTDDGTLEETRIVTHGANSLTFQGVGTGNFKVLGVGEAHFNGVSLANISSTSLLKLEVGSAGKFQLKTPNVTAGIATANQVLTFDGTFAEFKTLTPTGVPDISIYTDNGILTTDRFVTGNGKDLLITGVDHFQAQGNKVSIDSVDVNINATSLKINTPGAATGKAGHVLTWQSTDGKAEWNAISSAVPTLYTANGDIQTVRTVNLNNSLTFAGTGGGFAVNSAQTLAMSSKSTASYSAVDTVIGGSTSLKIQTPLATGSKAVVGHVLTTSTTDGKAEWTAPAVRNIYTHSDDLTSDRNVGLNSKVLTFNGPGSVNFNMLGGPFAVYGGANTYLDAATTLAFKSAGSLLVQTHQIGSVAPPSTSDVLTLKDPLNGRVEYATPWNLYSKDGNLTSDRILTGLDRNLSFNGVKQYNVDSKELKLGGTTSIKLQPPGFGTSTKGMVFTAKENGTGNGEWSAIPTVPTFYTHNGSTPGQRDVTLGGTLNWYASGNTINHDMFSGQFLVQNASTIGLGGVATVISGTTSLNVKTPLVNGPVGTRPPVGSVLKLTDPATGKAEFEPATATAKTIYTDSDSLTSARTVTQAGHALTFQSGAVGNFTVQGGPQARIQGTTAILEAHSTGQLHVRTPLVLHPIISERPANNTVLTLKDRLTGRVEFEPAAATAKTIYTGDDSLTTARTVNQAGLALTFQSSPIGSGNFTVQGSPQARIQGTKAIIESAPAASSGELNIRTPQVLHATPASRPPNNSVLTLKDRNTGRVEFEPLVTVSAPLVYYCELHAVEFSPNVFHFDVQNEIPTLPPTGSGAPARGTRLIAKLIMKAPESSVSSSLNAMAAIFWPAVPSVVNDVTFFSPPKGQKFAAGELQNDLYVDLVWVNPWPFDEPGSIESDTPGGWIMMNAGWKSATRTTALELESSPTQSTAVSGTNIITNQATVKMLPPTVKPAHVSRVGVVDTMADLAGAGDDFKLISTLGKKAIGDGGHESYYLTDYNPEISTDYAVRLTSDPKKMWRQLVKK